MNAFSNFQTLMGLAPLFIDAEVGRLANDTVVLTYSKGFDAASIPATTDFTIAGTAQTITDVEFWGNEVRLVMSAALLNTDVLTVSYTKGTNPLRDSSIKESVDLVTESIVNNII